MVNSNATSIANSNSILHLNVDFNSNFTFKCNSNLLILGKNARIWVKVSVTDRYVNAVVIGYRHQILDRALQFHLQVS